MNTCKTCIHWREVTNGSKPVRLDDVTVRNCTAQPPKSDYLWPRTMEHHTCGAHAVQPAADLLGSVETAAVPRKARRAN